MTEPDLPKITSGVATSVIRTIVPIVVAAIVTLLAKIGLQADDAITTGLTELIGSLAGVLYYWIVRLIEQVYPAASVFLGSPQQPVGYGKPE